MCRIIRCGRSIKKLKAASCLPLTKIYLAILVNCVNEYFYQYEYVVKRIFIWYFLSITFQSRKKFELNFRRRNGYRYRSN